MLFFSDPPEMTTFFQDKPTLLVTWWVTLFSTSIILTRVIGRLVRTEHMFPEDITAFWSLIPLYIRQAFIHCVILWGTNNADFTDEILTENQVYKKQLASGFVLIARIFFALTLWVLKWSTLEFLKRLTDSTWERSYTKTILYARIALAFSFFVVVVTIFTECTPFTAYWQVLPDPGPHCRQAYAHLIVTGVMNIVTDLMLVIIPIPIIIRSTMTPQRKTTLITLFSLNLSVVVVSLIRVQKILEHRGNQQYRTLMASVELLFAVASANALVLGSFVRDKGIKKRKFKFGEEMPAAINPIAATATPPMQRHQVYKHQWGSDEDLVAGLGLGLKPELRTDLKTKPDGATTGMSQPSASALGLRPMAQRVASGKKDSWQMSFHSRQKSKTEMSEDSLLPNDHHNEQVLAQQQSPALSPMPPVATSPVTTLPVVTSPMATSPTAISPAQAAAIANAASTPLTSTKGPVSFFDLGGLLEAGGTSIPSSDLEDPDDNGLDSFRRRSYIPDPSAPSVEQLLAQQQNESYWAYQSAMLSAPMPTASLAGYATVRRASTAILQDLGGMLAPIMSAGEGNVGNVVPLVEMDTNTSVGTIQDLPSPRLGSSHGKRAGATRNHSRKVSNAGKSVSSPTSPRPRPSPGPSSGTSPEDGPGFSDLGALLN